MKCNPALLRLYAAVLLIFTVAAARALSPDSIYMSNIRTARLYAAGNELGLPVINLNSMGQLELHFDDLDADVKYYYYTYQLCNSDWTPVDFNQAEYIRGFLQMRIQTYHFSSIALTRYTHYQATLPDPGGYPTRSGNYILKVYLNGDTSQLAFTRRLMITGAQASVTARVIQPFAPSLAQTSQRLQFTVGIRGVDVFNAAQQVKVVILQNRRWDNAQTGFPPTFIRGSDLEYNSENLGVFPAGKEWRWLDITDFHLQSERVRTATYHQASTDIYLKTDVPRDGQQYIYYHDLNGGYVSPALRGLNPYYEGDYAMVYFSLAPPGGAPYAGRDIYLYGALTDYNYADSLKMVFDPTKGIYETHLFLKQGYYDYTYVAVDPGNPAQKSELDGNYYETENLYTILVYYRSFSDRSDELIGVANVDSRADGTQPAF